MTNRSTLLTSVRPGLHTWVLGERDQIIGLLTRGPSGVAKPLRNRVGQHVAAPVEDALDLVWGLLYWPGVV